VVNVPFECTDRFIAPPRANRVQIRDPASISLQRHADSRIAAYFDRHRVGWEEETERRSDPRVAGRPTGRKKRKDSDSIRITRGPEKKPGTLGEIGEAIEAQALKSQLRPAT